MKSLNSTPDNLLSGQKGTVIFWSNPLVLKNSRSRPDPLKSNVNVHSPLRLFHVLRSNCGLGYSARGTAKAVAAVQHRDRKQRERVFIICELYAVVCRSLSQKRSVFRHLPGEFNEILADSGFSLTGMTLLHVLSKKRSSLWYGIVCAGMGASPATGGTSPGVSIPQ